MSWFFGEKKFSSTKLKTQLKMASQRIILVNNKIDNTIKRQKKEIAKLLEIGKEEKARIKVEHVISDDFTIEAHELLELLCETLVARLPLLVSQKECPLDLLPTVYTLLWCQPRVQIPELREVRKELVKKYGKEFCHKAMKNADGVVNERIIHKLSIQPPNAFLVLNYLKEIAAQYHVNWTATTTLPEPQSIGNGVPAPFQPMPAPTGFSVTAGTGSGYTDLYSANAGGLPIPPAAINNNESAVNGFSNQVTTPGHNSVEHLPSSVSHLPSSVSEEVLPRSGSSQRSNAKLSGGAADIPMPPGSSTGLGDIPMPPGTSDNFDNSVPTNTVDGSKIFPPPSSSSNNLQNSTNADGANGAPDFDELTARFNALRGL